MGMRLPFQPIPIFTILQVYCYFIWTENLFTCSDKVPSDTSNK